MVIQICILIFANRRVLTLMGIKYTAGSENHVLNRQHCVEVGKNLLHMKQVYFTEQ